LLAKYPDFLVYNQTIITIQWRYGVSFLGVIADDLTGAMDAGMQMLGKGIIKVALCHDKLDEVIHGSDVVVVNMQTRNGCAKEAYSKTKNTFCQLFKKGCNVFYKKIDSTLRGHIGVELKAILDSELFDCCILAPALPLNRRFTIDGIHYVDNVRLSDTEYAKDPFTPIKSSAISDNIREEYNTQIGLIDLKLIRESSLAVCEEIDKLVKSGIKVIIADAVEECDLKTIAHGLKLYGGKKVLCGSAGLFKYFDIVYNIKMGDPISNRNLKGVIEKNPILAISGSYASMSKKQLEYVAKSGGNIKIFKFDVSSLIDKAISEEWRVIAEKILFSLEAEDNVVLDFAGLDKETVTADHINIKDELTLISKSIAEITYHVLSNKAFGGLVIFGGDTAFVALTRLGVKGIEILGQIEPYIPYGKLIGGSFSGMPVVTKAGGFGQETTLFRIFSTLRGEDENGL